MARRGQRILTSIDLYLSIIFVVLAYAIKKPNASPSIRDGNRTYCGIQEENKDLTIIAEIIKVINATGNHLALENIL